MQTIGFATIAESPRDDVIPAMRPYLPADVRIAERGCLDGLSRSEIESLGPGAGEVGIVARLKAGGSTLLSHGKILPQMQRCVDELIREEGADLVVILCGADWSAIRAERLVVNPGRLFPGVIGGLAHGRRLGIIKPSAGQVDAERARYRARGSMPSSPPPIPTRRRNDLRWPTSPGRSCAMPAAISIWMTCIGMDAAMRDVVTEITGKPVVFAQAILARIVAELVPAGNRHWSDRRQPHLV